MASKPQPLTAAEQSLHNQVNILPRGQLLVVFGTLSVALLITFIDQNGISITLPSIANDLDAADTISWAGTSSLLANTTFQMLYGRLSDIFGRKNVFLAAIGLLAVADLLCGLAKNPAMLYVFRGMAGIGGGGITNLAMIIVSDVVTLEQRGKYQGILGAMVGLGNVGGPFLAAAFVEKATWRAFFYMLAPLGVAAGVLACFYLPDKPPTAGFRESASKIDYAGSLSSSVGVIFLLIPISGGGAYFPWDSPLVISMLTIGSIFIIAFVAIEWKFAKLPMMPLNIFRTTPVSVMMIQSFLFGAVYQSYLYYIPLYLQNAAQFSVMMSAGIYCALVAFQTLFSVLSGQYISRCKRYGEVIWLGFVSWTFGAGLTLIYKRTTSPGVIIAPLIFVGIGVGAVVISNRNFFRCAGGAVGLAVSAAVMQAALRANLPKGFEYLADSIFALPTDLIGEGPDLDMVLDAYMHASRAVFILQVPLIGLCLVGCLLIRDRGLQPADEVTQTSSSETVIEGGDPDQSPESEAKPLDLESSSELITGKQANPVERIPEKVSAA